MHFNYEIHFNLDNPAIVAAQSRVIVREGQRAELVVYTSLLPTEQSDYSIAWIKNLNMSVPDSDDNRQIIIDSAQSSDAGNYTVQIRLIRPPRQAAVKITLEVYGKFILTQSITLCNIANSHMLYNS